MNLLFRRRPPAAGYIIVSEGSRAFDDPGYFFEIPLFNLIRPHVRAWREAGYPGITVITKRLWCFECPASFCTSFWPPNLAIGHA